MIIDTSFIEPLYQAEKKKTYKELVSYMIDLKFDKSFYINMNIYHEEYSYKDYSFYAPLSILFLLYYYRGAYVKAKKILDKPEASGIKLFFLKELTACEKTSNLGHTTYEFLYGDKAELIKKKISNSMKNLDRLVIEKRNKSISQYASKRPESHNENISKARKKQVIDNVTGEIYITAKEASLATGICLSYIRQSCQGKRNPSFSYITK